MSKFEFKTKIIKGKKPTKNMSKYLIKNENSFRAKIEEGLIHAQKGRLVTFGVIPTKAETGYGYIESFDELSESVKQSSIKRFIEKPDISTAKQFIKDKHFYGFNLNSGKNKN